MGNSKYKYPLISYDKVTNQRKITRIHSHEEYELYYLVSGKTKYFVGNETYVLNAGNLIFIPSNILHSCDSEDTLHNERILLGIPSSFIDNSMAPVINELKNCKFIYIPSENLYIIEELINKIKKEYKKSQDYNEILIRLYILELLTLLCRLKKNQKPVPSQTDVVIKEVAAYIRNNFGSPLGLDGLSRQFAISKEYLSRQFKSVLGIGFNDYVTYVRITNAEKLLKDTNLPMTEVAALCGFNDSNYFAAVFKKFKGITPYKYSKSYTTKK